VVGLPQDGQPWASEAPHSAQNFAVSGLAVPHAVHCMVRLYVRADMFERVAAMDVGIRELRAHLSRYVERVKEGDEIVVTGHGAAAGGPSR
jgi:hypothetical protein